MLVVEGYMDVVALAQLGFPNAVATLGTACTPIHVQKLLRQTDTVIFSFDGDSAGRRAARRALEACLPHAGTTARSGSFSAGRARSGQLCARGFGEAAFSEQVERAMPLSQFLLNEAIAGKALDQPEGRAKALFDAKPLLQALPANALRAQIMHVRRPPRYPVRRGRGAVRRRYADRGTAAPGAAQRAAPRDGQ